MSDEGKTLGELPRWKQIRYVATINTLYFGRMIWGRHENLAFFIIIFTVGFIAGKII